MREVTERPDQGEKAGILRASRFARWSPPGVSLLILLLALASVAVLVMACGQGDDPTTTPAPTSTAVSQPAATALPQPTATAVPQPTATAAPQPTATAVPQPTATSVPEPTATAVPEPTATPVPEPTATATAVPQPTATPAPTAAPEPQPVEDDDHALTRAYVQKAIDFYEANGREATIEHYSLITEDRAVPSLGPDRRYLFLVDPETYVLLASPIHYLNNQVMGLIAPGGPFHAEVAKADENGVWVQSLRPNVRTGQQEPARYLVVLHDGLLFMSAHQVIQENLEAATKEYVTKAIGFYQQYGPLATESYYNSLASVEGQFYLFMTDENDIYVVHPIEPERIGTDIKEVTDSAGDPLGQRIAQATEEGVWVEYFWPHPVTGEKELKTTWAIRHDGKIFASGYYTASPTWAGEDPWEFTQDYVSRAVERYNDDGLESMRNYYNSVVSFEGQWYLFATDENDSYIVHPVFPNLIGTDIKALTGKDSEGNPLGESLAKAADGGEGIRVEYQWPHPITLVEAPKIAYAVRRGGILFASGYYPLPEEPRMYTQDYVAEAIAYYENHGLAATVEYYRSKESVAEGVWFLALLDKDGKFLTHYVNDGLIGTDAEDYWSPDGTDVGSLMLASTEEGHWFQATFPNVRGAGDNHRITWAVRHDGLVFASGYFGAPTDLPATPKSDDERTAAYVQKAIDYYDANGLEATTAQYRSEAATENGRTLTLIDAEDSVLLVYRTIISLEGQYVGPGSRFPGIGRLIAAATAEGRWFDTRAVNPITRQEEPRRVFAVLHDGLVFTSGHSILTEDVANSTREYVNKAIARYEQDGLDATIAHYNSQDSLDGQFYLFLIGADDLYLAHPIFPHLIGTDIKDVVGSDGQELGREIAQATEEGVWVEYLWPHPVSRREQQKVTWAARHDGLIFASGYYAGAPETGTAAWQDADPREYTVDYVERAIARYERDGLESMLDYYNSVASFEGEWYLFATDKNDIYHVHPLLGRLIGTDIKDVVGSDGYELGKALAAAEDGGEGVWVEYLWPHPVTLQEVPKVGYAVRRGGMLFASGYYPQVEDPAGQTQAYVQKAIEYYRANGLDATIAHYNSQESVDGQWSLTMADGNDVVRVAVLSPNLIGTDIKDLARGRSRQIGEELAAATTEGIWVSHIFPNTRSSEMLYAHNWAIRYDGFLFTSRYYDDRPDVPDSAKSDDALTRAYVQMAIDYYDANGRDAAIAHYNNPESIEGERMMYMLSPNLIMLTFAVNPRLAVGAPMDFGGGVPGSDAITAAGIWAEHRGLDPATGETGPMRFFYVRHGGLIFASGHSILRENVAEATQDYVNRAIARYERDGPAATIAHYNDLENSREGQFYLFLIGEDDIYLAHPLFPHFIGAKDIKDVAGSDGDPLGRRIAQATEEGIWVEYLWPHPLTREELPKVAWVVRHDGLIFASGYYTGGSEEEAPPWQDVTDPRQYTVEYVNRAIERYQRDGLEAMLNYYNSVASFEGEWYLFATDENDLYHVHPLLPHLIGTDIKNVVGKDGFELGKALAAAQDGGEGVWVEYLWPHVATLKEVPKVGYAVRHDGMLFASGYYPKVADPAGHTQAYVQKAIDYFNANGLEATIAYYNSPESSEGEWVLSMADENYILRVAGVAPYLIGRDIRILSPSSYPDLGAELAAATEQGVWVTHEYHNVNSPEQLYAHWWAIRHEGLLFMSRYHDNQPGNPGQVNTDDDLTRAYVQKAIDYYDANGLDATTAQYRSEAGVENGRTLTLIDAEDSVLLVHHVTSLEGHYVGPGSRFPGFAGLIAAATAEGRWFNTRAVNPVTRQEEPRRVFAILHDGLVFTSSHSVLAEDVANSTREYVNKAIARYEQDGLDATIAHYNSQDSLDGQFYLFLIGADDLYLAHPIFPHLIGTDIKDVVGSDGQELGKEIAQATGEGVWVEYLWPHPVSRREQQKVTWAARHDGLIFASGYYAGAPETGTPAWQDADPREYTVQYVERAIARYERDGLESMLDYYNSVASFEGEWYLFATDKNDIYHVHPLLGRLIGTDIKDVVGSDGYELGKALAAAEDGGEGVWVEYLWPHPVTLQEVPKVGYAVRRGGMLFASGYYPQVEDPAGQTQAYVQKAIEYYRANGLDATIAHYNSQDSVDGQWSLTMADGNDVVRVAVLSPNLIDTDIKDLARGRSRQIGEELAAATTEGTWVSHIFPNTRSSETLYAHNWAIRYDGLLFTSRYYDDRPDVRD